MDFGYILSILLLVFGFGFVIFWHELGHFLAAKWAGVKVEQFAVGFGQALLSYRKGLGVRIGTSTAEFEARVQRHIDERRDSGLRLKEATGSATPDEAYRAAQELRISETEYRLNWIPLGGYVKMLGQDDLNPNAQVSDPRAYNNKSIGKRMVIVSAGVIMNVILAAVGFCVLFMIGFNAPPAIVGEVLPGSPAQQAGLKPGDRIVRFDGAATHDFTKVRLGVALADPTETVPVVVRRLVDGQVKELTLQVRPVTGTREPGKFLSLGISPAAALQAPEEPITVPSQNVSQLLPAEMLALKPGDRIVAINGRPVPEESSPEQRNRERAPAVGLALLDEALQQSQGRPLTLTVRGSDGQSRDIRVRPQFVPPFAADSISFAGMEPRVMIEMIEPSSSAAGKLLPGDVVLSVRHVQTGDPLSLPTDSQLRQLILAAGQSGNAIAIEVERDGAPMAPIELTPSTKIDGGQRGLGVVLGTDEAHPVIAGVHQGSPAEKAGVPQGATIVSIAGEPVASWHDVRRIIAGADPSAPLALVVRTDAGERRFELPLAPEHVADARNIRYRHQLPLAMLTEERTTTNPLQAAWWGVLETRDMIAQFYLTLQRIGQGSVAAKNIMGPVGIFQQGSAFAERGTDWLLWFLSMISANLAVVNFLPIPIVDGGLFLFLIIEKLQGRPVSPRVQSIAQVVGLALILSIFLFATYHDIRRF